MQPAGWRQRDGKQLVDCVVDELNSPPRRHAGAALSNLFLYRLVFSLGRLDLRGCPRVALLLSSMAIAVRTRVQVDVSSAFPARYLVRMAWTFGRLGIRDANLFADLSGALQRVVDDLTFEELLVVQHVFAALKFSDSQLLGRVEDVVAAMRKYGAVPPSDARKSSFLPVGSKKVSLAQPIVSRKKMKRPTM
eukprot:GHVT01062513.1.p1 GENE.GHVT01062513.1~~GHVT01062513.1.p1  ORF type:complete len:192 (+),score=40.23 GHVT01062513.1:403-978(+)